MKFFEKMKRTKEEVRAIIESFISEKGNEWDWDDFISIPIEDKYLESIRKRCVGLPEEFPSGKGEGYCNKEGLKVLQNYVNELSG